MEAGNLNREIVLKYYGAPVATDIGGTTRPLLTAKTTLASISAMSDKESITYGLEIGQRNYKVVLRFDPNYEIDNNYMIVYTNRFNREVILNVVSVIVNDEDFNMMTLITNERSS